MQQQQYAKTMEPQQQQEEQEEEEDEDEDEDEDDEERDTRILREAEEEDVEDPQCITAPLPMISFRGGSSICQHRRQKNQCQVPARPLPGAWTLNSSLKLRPWGSRKLTCKSK